MKLSENVINQLKCEILDIINENYLFEPNKKLENEFYNDVVQMLYRLNIYNDEHDDFRPINLQVNVVIDVVYDENYYISNISVYLLEYKTTINIQL